MRSGSQSETPPSLRTARRGGLRRGSLLLLPMPCTASVVLGQLLLLGNLVSKRLRSGSGCAVCLLPIQLNLNEKPLYLPWIRLVFETDPGPAHYPV